MGGIPRVVGIVDVSDFIFGLLNIAVVRYTTCQFVFLFFMAFPPPQVAGASSAH